MCGISVIINRQQQEVDPDRIHLMNTTIAHRGPDGHGIYCDGNVGLGHRRLSIIDLSENADQPYLYRDYAMTFNGEIYNYIELREELQSYGISFNTVSDTEVLLKAYIYWGKECVNRFNGMWAFVIYDKKENKIFASRDRFGIKPFYYYLSPSEIIISSEVKQILAINERPLNRQVLGEFITNGSLNHTHESFFEGILLLEEGYSLEYDLFTDDFSKWQYYDLEERTKSNLDISYEEACKRFYDLLESSVEYRLQSDVKLGLSLSGGLDSTSLAYFVSNKVDRLPTFSVLFNEKAISERKFVEAALRKYDVINTKITPTYNDIMKIMGDAVWYLDQPISTASILADYILQKHQKNSEVKVTISGQGADEIIAGYKSFQGACLKENLNKGRLFSATKNLKISLQNNNRWLKEKLFPKSLKILIDPIPNRNESFSMNSVKELSLRYIRINGLRMLLHYLDRNSMSSSIEGRVPFLDHRLVEFSLRLPYYYKLGNGITKKILRDAMGEKLPDIIRYRKNKLGYDTPERRWVEEHLGDIKERINQSSITKIIDVNIINTINENPSKSEADLLIRLLSTILWMNKFNVKL